MGGNSSTQRRVSPTPAQPIVPFQPQQAPLHQSIPPRQHYHEQQYAPNRLSTTSASGGPIGDGGGRLGPPGLTIQQTCVVKNPVNLRKKTLRLVKVCLCMCVCVVGVCVCYVCVCALRVCALRVCMGV
eukprot:GHVQ01016932.1.p2 GENE.GHVQ01016932.1~~GHVQ01016932.1.p2  ORF type:complete len:128 (+),score=30.09 GHVQ01016932.1:499-882(+)